VVSFLHVFRPKLCMQYFSFLSCPTGPTHHIFLDFIFLITFGEEYTLRSSSLCNFLQPPSLSPPRYRYHSQHSLQTHSICVHPFMFVNYKNILPHIQLILSTVERRTPKWSTFVFQKRFNVSYLVQWGMDKGPITCQVLRRQSHPIATITILFGLTFICCWYIAG
jgi:hypothetical protein